MSLLLSLVATCDSGPACEVSVEIDPGHTQPYRLLIESGWQVKTTNDGIETYCPMHKEAS